MSSPREPILVLTFLAAVTGLERDQHQATSELIPLTRTEIQHLFTTLVTPVVHDRAHRLRWSQWRRRQQAGPGPPTTAGRMPGRHEDQDPRRE